MSKNRKNLKVKELVQVRRLNEGFSGLGLQDIIAGSTFVCNEPNMDRAMDVADTQAKLGNSCVLIPFTVVSPA